MLLKLSTTTDQLGQTTNNITIYQTMLLSIFQTYDYQQILQHGMNYTRRWVVHKIQILKYMYEWNVLFWKFIWYFQLSSMYPSQWKQNDVKWNKDAVWLHSVHLNQVGLQRYINFKALRPGLTEMINFNIWSLIQEISRQSNNNQEYFTLPWVVQKQWETWSMTCQTP